MIQRIQTLFLLAVVALHIALYYVSFWVAEHEGVGEVMILRVGDVQTKGSSASAGDPLDSWVLGLAVVNGLITLLSLITIFLFNRRMLQLRLTRIALFLEVVLVGLTFYTVEKAKALLPPTDEMEYGIGAFFPLVCIILIFLAGQRILRDERLVRSADRLR